MITLTKSEASYSPTTMYRDYPISPTLLHWESQSTTSEASPTGKRYLTGTRQVLLFVREQQRDEPGTVPYLFLGPAHYVSHQSSRPIAITWQLERAIPVDVFNTASVAALWEPGPARCDRPQRGLGEIGGALPVSTLTRPPLVMSLRPSRHRVTSCRPRR